MNYFIVLFLAFTSIAICYEETYTDNSKNYCNRKGIYDKRTKLCTCIEDYVTYPMENYQQTNQCNYVKKSKLMLKIISFFWGYLGADQLYLGNAVKGSFKVIIPIVTLFIVFYLKNCSKAIDLPDYYFLIPFVLSISLWVIDFVSIVLMDTRDHYGIELV